MNKIERIKTVKAMEYLARQLNDETIFDEWLTSGVADGDIEFGDLAVKAEDMDELNTAWYCEDARFADLMDTFLHCMRRAYKSGGLFCDGVVSKAG